MAGKVAFSCGPYMDSSKITSYELYYKRILLKKTSCQVYGDLGQDAGRILQETIPGSPQLENIRETCKCTLEEISILNIGHTQKALISDDISTSQVSPF